MPFPIRVCVVCHEEFELRPGKPGFANRCPACSEPEEKDAAAQDAATVDPGAAKEINAASRAAMRNLLYRKDS